MVNAKDDDSVSKVIDSVQDSIAASPGAEDASEFISQLSTDTVRILDQRSCDEFDDRDADRVGKSFGDSPSGRSCHLQLVWSSTH
jgi:hypothetical protein